MGYSFKGHSLKVYLWKANLLKWMSTHHAVLHSEAVAHEGLLLMLIGEG